MNGSLAEMAADLSGADAVEALAERIFSCLGEVQRTVLALLAAMERAPVHVSALAKLTDIADVAPVVESLLVLALVQAHSPRFSVTADLP